MSFNVLSSVFSCKSSFPATEEQTHITLTAPGHHKSPSSPITEGFRFVYPKHREDQFSTPFGLFYLASNPIRRATRRLVESNLPKAKSECKRFFPLFLIFFWRRELGNLAGNWAKFFGKTALLREEKCSGEDGQHRFAVDRTSPANSPRRKPGAMDASAALSFRCQFAV